MIPKGGKAFVLVLVCFLTAVGFVIAGVDAGAVSPQVGAVLLSSFLVLTVYFTMATAPPPTPEGHEGVE